MKNATATNQGRSFLLEAEGKAAVLTESAVLIGSHTSEAHLRRNVYPASRLRGYRGITSLHTNIQAEVRLRGR